MAGEITTTVVGNLTADPELRFTSSGQAVCNWTVATNPRRFDRDSQEWKDGDAFFLRCSVWRIVAENVAESLRKGDQVVVQGELLQRTYETREGEKRTVVEMAVRDVGLSLRFHAARSQRPARSYNTAPPEDAPPPAEDPHTGEDISPPKATRSRSRKAS